MRVRNKMYDEGILKSYKISVPVISIGNVTTGGSGKTPLTILIAKQFLRFGLKVAVISRGYRRESNEILIASTKEAKELNPELFGDELTMIFDNMKNIPDTTFYVAASSDRVLAAEKVIKMHKPDIIMLDDAFQHRRIRRDLDIVLFDAGVFSKTVPELKFTIPSGILRESLTCIDRADVLIQNNKADEFAMITLNSRSPNTVMRYKTECIMDWKSHILQEARNAVVFSGIADDRSFLRLLENQGIQIQNVVRFRDHHTYLQSDIDELKKQFSGNNIFITTEKDFIKIKRFEAFVKDYPVYFLKLEVEFVKGADYIYDELKRLTE